jgi:hypothetical protein
MNFKYPFLTGFLYGLIFGLFIAEIIQLAIR